MTTLSPEQPIAELPAGSYRARAGRSYASPGRCRIGTAEQPLATFHVGGKGRAPETIFTHPGGPLALVCDRGVSATVELTRIGD